MATMSGLSRGAFKGMGDWAIEGLGLPPLSFACMGRIFCLYRLNNGKFGQLIFVKIVKSVAIRCLI